MSNSLEALIEELKLTPHPEGGYYRETYRSAGEISKDQLSDQYSGSRNHCTCIYFLLTSENFSAFHRINQDEIWHFYDGSPIRLHVISPDGQYSKHLIGSDLKKAQVPQFVVPGGSWFAAEVAEPDSFSLLGCTVSPGFDFDDFELADRSDLTAQFPNLFEVIENFTR